MNKLIILVVIIFLFENLESQTPSIPVSEMQQTMFITEVHGVQATFLNPAGLSTRADDDGVFLNYGFLDLTERGEINFLLSMSNLAFSAQEFSLNRDEETVYLRTYRASISVGGRVLSIGTSNKIMELKWPHHHIRVFSVDAGFLFQPMQWIAIAAVAKDIDEPTLEDYAFKRQYSAGIGIRLCDQRFKLLGQMYWDDSLKYLEDAKYKVGICISPVQNLELLVGSVQNPNQNEEFFAAMQIPICADIRLAASARVDENKHFLRYTASLLFSLRTVEF